MNIRMRSSLGKDIKIIEIIKQLFLPKVKKNIPHGEIKRELWSLAKYSFDRNMVSIMRHGVIFQGKDIHS